MSADKTDHLIVKDTLQQGLIGPTSLGQEPAYLRYIHCMLSTAARYPKHGMAKEAPLGGNHAWMMNGVAGLFWRVPYGRDAWGPSNYTVYIQLWVQGLL